MVAVVGLLFVGSFSVPAGPQSAVLRNSLSSSVTPLNNTTYCGVLGPNPGNTSDTAPEYYPNVTAVWDKLCLDPLFDTTLTSWGGLYNNTTAHALRSHNITIGETNASYVTNGTPWRYDPSAQANFFVWWVQSCANNTNLNCDHSAEWKGNLSNYAITGPFLTNFGCQCNRGPPPTGGGPQNPLLGGLSLAWVATAVGATAVASLAAVLVARRQRPPPGLPIPLTPPTPVAPAVAPGVLEPNSGTKDSQPRPEFHAPTSADPLDDMF
ncbi:MAG: hypothetical protein WB852_00390 [Thermoplasmata archaeon]